MLQVTEIAAILTPIIIFIASAIIIPLIARLKRQHYVISTKLDCIIIANKSISPDEVKEFGNAWGKVYDREFDRRIAEQKFVNN